MNSFGNKFRVTTFGESHGAAVGGVIDGCPSGLNVDMQRVESMLARRRGDNMGGTTPRKECDQVEWLSGLLDGVTLGTPITFVVRNEDVRSEDYELLKDCYRPGHADYTYTQRYGLRDWRGGGRASGRETVARVVAGVIALQLLEQRGIVIKSTSYEPEQQNNTDTIGGVVECVMEGVPAGWGDPVFGKLNARLAAAMMSIPSAVGFEMGAGFAAVKMTGSQYADQWNLCHSANDLPLTRTNHCGGVQGGISNGMPIVFRVAFHPVVTQTDGMDCLAADGTIRHVKINGRHDRCHVRRIPPIVEAMAALVLADIAADRN